MRVETADWIVALAAAYLAIGAAFAGAFLTFGVARFGAAAAAGSRGFRLAIAPGVVALWPVVAIRWWRAR